MADAARARFQFRNLRLTREQAERAGRLARKAQEKLGQPMPDAKRALILAALERARQRKAGLAPRKADQPPPPRAGAAAIDTRRKAAKKP